MDSDSTSVAPVGSASLRGSNQSGMRAQNERLVLSLVRRRGSLAKAEIARITGLSAQAVSVIIRSLEQDKLLQRGERIRGKVGQPSVPMSINPEGAFFFGLKVGRRSADLVLTDFTGRILSRMHLTYAYPTPDGTLRFARDSVNQLMEQLTPDQISRIAGLGMAIPFFMWEWSETIGADADRMADWKHRDLRAEIDALFDFPVFQENDATSACGAELVFGTGDRPPDFLYFYIGYFVGGGLVLNNRLFTGPSGNAGALGPLPMPTRVAPGRQLVEVASLITLERQLPASDRETIWENATAWDIDATATEVWLDEAGAAIAHAIVCAISIIDLGLVVLDGWMPKPLRGRLVQSVQTHLANSNLSGLYPPEIREGTVGPDARALGAASLPLSQRFMPES